MGSSSQGLDGSGHLGGWSRSEGPPAGRSRDGRWCLNGGTEPWSGFEGSTLMGLTGCVCRRPTTPWWNTSEKTPRPRPPPCSLPSLVASSRPTRYVSGRQAGTTAGFCSLSVWAAGGVGLLLLGGGGGGGGLSSWRPTLAPQKAEQEVEQWKKEAAALEAGAETADKGDSPALKVGSAPERGPGMQGCVVSSSQGSGPPPHPHFY